MTKTAKQQREAADTARLNWVQSHGVIVEPDYPSGPRRWIAHGEDRAIYEGRTVREAIDKLMMGFQF